MTPISDVKITAEALAGIRNQNEERIVSAIGKELAEFPDYPPTQRDIGDVYACALNKLPARYANPERTIFHTDPITDAMIHDAVHSAVITVLIRPR